MKQKKSVTWFVLALAMLAVAIIPACDGSEDPTGPSTTSTSSGTSTSSTGTSSSSTSSGTSSSSTVSTSSSTT